MIHTNRLMVGVVWGLFAVALGRAYALEPGPVAAWSFNFARRGMVLDVTGNRHHAVSRSKLHFSSSPGGQALIFDGKDDFLQVRNRPALQMDKSVTLDVWIWLDELNRPEPQCIVDKGGERYRLQVNGEQATFGLKCDTHRLDLTGGKLRAHTWHRITGVFERPRASLYIDGKLVAQRIWDHEIGPGGDLFIGAKSGENFFFKGQIDELRIYRQARPPQASDAPSPDVKETEMAKIKMEVTEVPGGVSVNTGAIVFELRHEAVLRSLRVGQKTLVSNNEAPFLTAEIFESHDYDGWSDHATGKIIPAIWRPGGHEYSRTEKEFKATYLGRLDFGSGDAIACSLTISAASGSPFIVATTQHKVVGDFTNRFIRSVALHLPLALNKRKRIVQAGDRGVQWDTRHWYQFHVSTTMGLLPEPDHNIWRIFATDQNTAGDYHIWRSESTATCPLTMQRGLQAPGWMATYDQDGGLLFAYRGFDSRAPKSLRVMADGSGEALVFLWHAGLPALDIRSSLTNALFGTPHVTDWMGFLGEFGDTQPDVSLARHWGVDKLASDPPARNEIPLADLNLLDAPAAEAEAPLVTGGVPLPRGALKDPNNVRLQHEGADVPLQTRIVGYWPDKSIKWLLLTFPANGGEVQGAAGEGERLTFNLTRRDGARNAYRLEYGGTARPGAPQTVLETKQIDKNVSINTGPLQIEISTGQRWLRSVKYNGMEILAQGGARSFVDFLRMKESYPCMTTHAQGVLDNGVFVADEIQLEESGPLRAVVRLGGMTTTKEPTRVIIRIEAYAGRSVIRIFHAAEFLHKDPRVAFVRRMGIEVPLASMRDSKVTVGGQAGPVVLGHGYRAGLRQHSHLGYHAWHQVSGERFLRYDETKHRSRGWLDLSGPQGGVAVMLRDMWQQFPNEICADLQHGHITMFFWPESGPVMDMRRYSNYPHPSQGESAPSNSDWVEKDYYRRDPIVGVSKTHEMLFYFHAPDMDAAKVDAVAADFNRPPLVYAGGDWYVKTGVLLPQSRPSSDKFPRAHANLDHYARFWIHHQKLWGWYGFWDYGDVGHSYKTGYGSIVPAEKLIEIVTNPKKYYEKGSLAKCRVQDYAPNHEWAFDNGRWGWNNTEGLPGLYMQNQYLRTGDREIFFFAEAMARHFRDVDMRHDGMWFGQGTRHGVQHWSDGNHEERQTTHSEFRYVYALTGDPFSRDFARRLYEGVYSKRDVSVHASHSGRLQGLLTWWEMTGSDEVAAILAKYVPSFAVADGICESPAIRFPNVKCISQARDVNAGNMFFWTFGAGHGVLEYFYLTNNEELRRALIKAAAHAIKKDPDPGNFRKAVAFAARHADDSTPYRKYLTAWAKNSLYVTQIVPHNPLFYGGPCGILRGSVSGSLFAMNDMPYLLSALEADPSLTEEQYQALMKVDQNGGPYYSPHELSWQSEYDRPELAEYLRIKHTQP